MKRLVLLSLALAAGLLPAEDSYLYWMVNTDAADDFSYDAIRVKATKEGMGDSFLTIGWNNSGTFTSFGDDGLSGLNASDIADIKALEEQNTGFYASLANLSGDLGGWSYVVELLSGSTTVAQSTTLTAASAAEYVATTSAGAGLQNLASVWRPQSYAAPEPNSALLMVTGLALLALRRRKCRRACPVDELRRYVL